MIKRWIILWDLRGGGVHSVQEWACEMARVAACEENVILKICKVGK